MNEKYDLPIKFKTRFTVNILLELLTLLIFSMLPIFYFDIIISDDVPVNKAVATVSGGIILLCALLFVYCLLIIFGVFYCEMTEEGITYRGLIKKRFDWSEITSAEAVTTKELGPREYTEYIKGVKIITASNKKLYIGKAKFGSIDFEKFLNTVKFKADT